MKKTIILSMAVCAAFNAAADYDGPGYYRVQNYKTERWASMVDDKGSIDYAGTTADLQAIRLQKNFDEVCCDPASIIYIEEAGKQYSIGAQGATIYDIIGHYLNLRNAGSANGSKLYYASGTHEGFEKYVGDGELIPYDITYAVTSAKNDGRKWYIHPMTDEGDCFFGVRPTIDLDGKYFATMLGDFPFIPYSEGVKVYTVAAVGAGMALMEEVTGPVAKSTPVVFECASDKPSDNRLSVGVKAEKMNGNLLKGAYFCSTENEAHLNYIKFNPKTMRVLGICEDGSLGFITPEDLQYIPANTAYLPVSGSTPKELKCVNREQYEAGVDDIAVDDTTVDVYSISGVLVLKNADKESINALPAGVYIAGGKKFIVR